MLFQTGGILLLWFLPSLFWRGEPITERHRDRQGQEANADTNRDSLIEQALRRNFSPNGVLRLIMIDTVIVSAHFKSISMLKHSKSILIHCKSINVISITFLIIQLVGQIFFWTLAGLYPMMVDSDSPERRRRPRRGTSNRQVILSQMGIKGPLELLPTLRATRNGLFRGPICRSRNACVFR